jgi:hypothetical protein
LYVTHPLRYLPSNKLFVIPILQFLDNLNFTNTERFERHASYVRILYMDTPKIVISPRIHQHIHSIFHNPLLLHLKKIYMPGQNNRIDLVSVKPLASGTSLNSLTLNNSATSDQDFFTPFITSLATNSPQLQSLALSGSTDVSLEPIFFFKNLHCLDIRLTRTYLHPQTLRKLGSLDNLLDLTIDDSASETTLNTTVTIPFPSLFGMLRRLRIIGTPNSIARVLHFIQPPSLTNLVIEELPGTTNAHPQPFWVNCFRLLSRCQAIEEVEINQCEKWEDHRSLSTSWLGPLFDIKNMKSLVINGSSLSGSDQDFSRLAHSFPKLQKLIVPPKHHFQGRTIACLHYFNQECPGLQEIKISVSSDILDNLQAVEELPDAIGVNRQHPLQRLYITSEFGPIELFQTIQVAQFLDRYFPNLLVLEYYEPYPSSASYYPGSTEASTWEGIQLIRMALRATRIDATCQALARIRDGI